ncbi:MAG: Crp/Fnr family transcriptional regulator [Burkholderiales bacterium]|nr:Crp/Fnr family transcriptional regulator [Burkholderiales bacterium]
MLHTLSDRDPITLAPVVRPHCESRLLHALGKAPDASSNMTPPLRQRVATGTVLLHEGAPARHICVVQAGTFKSAKTGDDGYEHVLGFSLRGDLLGYDGLANGAYASAAVALEDSVVFTLPLRQFETLRHADAAFDLALQAALSQQMSRAIELAELMSAVAADARLARFLLHVSARMAEQGLSPRRLRLRMNRREIASHLGVAHETVSRCFSLLAERGYLLVDNREIEIVDMDGLRAHAHCTRGPAEEPQQGADPSRPALTRSSANGSRSRWRAAAAA